MSYWDKKLKELEEEEEKKKKKTVTPDSNDYWGKKMDELNKSSSSSSTVKTEDIAPVKDDRKWFEKGAFEDGYQFGDIGKTIGASVKDLKTNVFAGILGIGEKVVDAGAYLVGGAADLVGADKFADKTKDFIAKDLYDEKKVADKILGVTDPNAIADNVSKKLYGESLYGEENSVFGDKTDSLAQSGGQLLATAGLQAVGVPWYLTTGVTSFGAETENAFNQGATYGQAGLSATISAGAEILTEKLSGGIKFGGKALDEGLTKVLTTNISNKALRTMAKLGMDVVGEGTEEVISQVFSNLGSALYKEEDLSEIMFSEEAFDEYLESFIGGAVLGGTGTVTGVAKGKVTGRDVTSGLTANEETVLKQIYDERIKEAEQDGKKLTTKEKNAIYDEIKGEMEKGYISTDKIESILGGDTYKAYQDTIAKEDAAIEELKTLYKGEELDRAVRDILDHSKRTELKNKLSQEVADLATKGKDTYLSESYNEAGRRKQKFEADLTKYDAKAQETIIKAMESGVMNNTRRTHEFVDMVAKISADKGVLFDFTNNQKLAESGFAVEGKSVNGFVTKDGVTLNIDSQKALNSTVGHEITHVLEGTEFYDALQEAVFEYAKTKGVYEDMLRNTKSLYENIDGYKGVDGFNAIKREVVSDLVGDYLFGETDFINHLSTKNRNVFQKIYDEIKYLYKVATAGSKEAKELLKVKRAFEKAYQADGKADGETRYSLVEDQDTIDFLENQEHVTTYKAMVLIDGKLYPPMASQTYVDEEYTTKSGEKKTRRVRKLKNPSVLGKWQQSEERIDIAEKTYDPKKGYSSFDLLKSNGKTTGGVAYNPYEHTSNIVLNDQFSEAYQRPELVTVEYKIPASELTSGYKAQYAKDPVGLANWKAGGVAQKLKHSHRDVYLTRWSKPVRVLPDSEVAQKYKEILDKEEGVSVPWNVVTPSLRTELEKIGVPIDYSDIKAGSTVRTFDAFMRGEYDKSGKKGGVKYSVSDSDGTKLTDEQQKYFKDSKMRDENGALKVMYHGSQNAGNDDIRFSLSKPVEETKDLLVLHNISESKLIKQLELDGFPMPSLAVTNQPHTNFGVISILFDKDTIDPKKNKKNKTYSADAWTPMFPSIEYESDGAVERRFFDTIYGLIDNDHYKDGARSLSYDIEGVLNNRGGHDGLVEYLSEKPAIQYAFLKSKGENVGIAQKQKEIPLGFSADERWIARYEGLIEDFGGDISGIEKMPMKDIVEKSQTVKNLLEKIASPMRRNSIISKIVNGAIAYQNYDPNAKTEVEYIPDYAQTDKDIQSRINEKEFKAWLKEQTRGIVANSGVYNGKERYTPSGNRRSFQQLHYPVTVENIVKSMAAQGEKSVTSFHGVKTLRATTAKTFKSIADIQKSKGRLQNLSESEINRIHDELSDKMYQVFNKIIEENPNTFRKDDIFAMDTIGEVLSEVGYENINASYIKGVFDKYNYKMSSETADDCFKLLDAISSMPVYIFEAKPRRVVGYDEVKAVVIPYNTSDELKNSLAQRGINFVEYDGTEADRQAKLKEVATAKDVYFSLSKGGKSHGKYNVYGKDVRLEQDIAPVGETSQMVGETSQTVGEIAPVADSLGSLDSSLDSSLGSNYPKYDLPPEAMPVGANESEIARLEARAEELERTMLERDQAGDATLEEASALYREYMQTLNKIDDLKAQAAEAETQNAKRLETLNEEPPEAEAPFYGDNEESAPSDPFESRDYKAVGNQKQKAYMYENPEVKPFFQAEANVMLGELQRTTKGERWYTEIDGVGRYSGTKRHTSDDIAYLRDNGRNGNGSGYTYAEIEAGLKAIIEDNGKENNACSKRIEFLLNDRLLKGYRNMEGMDVPADENYVKFIREKEISEYSNEARQKYFEAKDEIAPVIETENPIDSATVSAEEFEKHARNIFDFLKDKPSNRYYKIGDYGVYMGRNSSDNVTVTIKKPNGENVRDTIPNGKYQTNQVLWEEVAHKIAKMRFPNVASTYSEQQTLFGDSETEQKTVERKPFRPERKVTEDPKKEKVAEVMVGEPEAPKKKKRSLMSLATDFVDKGTAVEKLSLKTKNRELQAKYNFMHYSENRAQSYIKNNLKPLLDKIEKTGKTQQIFDYAYHRHNISRMSLDTAENQAKREELRGKYFDGMSDKQIEQTAKQWITHKTPKDATERIKAAREYMDASKTKNKPVFGDSVTADVSRKKVQMYDKTNPEFAEIGNELVEYNKALRQLMVDNNLISQETADLWAKEYPYYVPIRRVDHEGEAIGVPLDSRKTGVTAPIKRATGGNSNIKNLGHTMAMRTEQIFKAIARNNFGLELMHTLDSVVDQTDASLEEVTDSLDKQEELLKKGENGNAPTFTVFENGKRVEFEITEELYDSMRATSPELARTHLSSKAVEAFKKVTTQYNPKFMVSNPIKDIQDIILNSQHPLKTYANLPKAFFELATHGKYFTEYMENGGEQNTYFDGEKKDFEKTFKEYSIPKKILFGLPRGINIANDFMERAPRLAEYMASRKKGASVETAMLDAARVTTNFSAGGDITKYVGRNFVPFLNPSVQGAAQQVRNVREAYADGFTGVLKLTAKYAVAGIPAVLLNALYWDDDEEYEELSDYVKENYYIVAKFDDGKFVRIPKGRTVSVLQSAVEQTLNVIQGEEADFGSTGKLAVTNLAPNNPLDSNILSTWIQIQNNKTWYGEDLVPTRLQDVPKSEQYDESIDLVSKWLGEKLNVSPYHINYLIDQYTGGIGDALLPMITPETTHGETTLGDYAIAPYKDLFTTDSVMKNQNVSDFYEKVDELTKNANSMHATSEDILKSKYMNSINSELGELYKKKREYQSDTTIPKDRKYTLVRRIQQQIDELAKEALNTYNNVVMGGDKYGTDRYYATVGDRQFRWYQQDDDETGSWVKLNDKQIERQNDVTKALGITPNEYWSNRKEEFDYAYDYPEKYSLSKAVGGYDAYKTYASELYDIKADKDASGKTITGSRKKKVVAYINNLDADYYEKIILFKSEYTADDTYNYEIINYLNSRDDISYKEMEMILKELGFTVDSKGNISW